MKQDENTTLTDVESASEETLTEEMPTNVATNGENNQLPPNVVKVKGRWWISYLITFAVLAVMTVLVAWARGCFTETDKLTLIGYWCDAFSVPGILGVCFGLLVVASKGGAFDMLVYAVMRIFSLLKRDPVDRKYGGFYEYKQTRHAKKRSFWHLIIVGGAYLLVGVILLVVYYAV